MTMSWASRHNLLARAVNQNLGGVSVVWGAISGVGILEQNSEMVLSDQVITVEYALHNLPTAEFGGLSYGDAVTIDGVLYEVRHEALKVGDGQFCMVPLTRSTEEELTVILDGDFL